jgi:hypothetical protein
LSISIVPTRSANRIGMPRPALRGPDLHFVRSYPPFVPPCVSSCSGGTHSLADGVIAFEAVLVERVGAAARFPRLCPDPSFSTQVF